MLRREEGGVGRGGRDGGKGESVTSDLTSSILSDLAARYRVQTKLVKSFAHPLFEGTIGDSYCK